MPTPTLLAFHLANNTKHFPPPAHPAAAAHHTPSAAAAFAAAVAAGHIPPHVRSETNTDGGPYEDGDTAGGPYGDAAGGPGGGGDTAGGGGLKLVGSTFEQVVKVRLFLGPSCPLLSMGPACWAILRLLLFISERHGQ